MLILVYDTSSCIITHVLKRTKMTQHSGAFIFTRDNSAASPRWTSKKVYLLALGNDSYLLMLIPNYLRLYDFYHIKCPKTFQVCQCNSDGCNGAQNLQLPFALFFASVLLAIFHQWWNVWNVICAINSVVMVIWSSGGLH